MLWISELQLDCNYLSPQFVEDYIDKLMWIGGLIYVLIFLPIFYWAQCRAKKAFKKLYPNEEIVYEVSSGIIMTVVGTYIFGVAFCMQILPFLVFKNLYAYDTITRNNLWLFGVAHIASVWILLIRFSLISILSDKRIKTFVNFYKISKKQELKHNILYRDIESVEFYYYYFRFQALSIKFKDKRPIYNILCMINLKQAENIILQYISKERI